MGIDEAADDTGGGISEETAPLSPSPSLPNSAGGGVMRRIRHPKLPRDRALNLRPRQAPPGSTESSDTKENLGSQIEGVIGIGETQPVPAPRQIVWDSND